MASLESKIFQDIPNIAHGFGSRLDPVPSKFLKIWVAQKPQWSQVHGVDIPVIEKPGQQLGECDGMYTTTLNPISIISADCCPILLARRDGKAVAAIHAGWRGTLAKIVEKFASDLKTRDDDPKNWVAAIGPAIGGCCYQVGEDLIEKFKAAFPYYEPENMIPSHRKLDLPTLNAAELERVGFSDVDLMDHCTYCDMDLRGPKFHSYRREGQGVRQWSVIQRTR